MNARMILAVSLMALTLGCSEGSTSPQPANETTEIVAEETHPIRGVIRGRDSQKHEITLEHEAIPGYMGAMTMSFRVPEGEFARLPADGSTVEGTLNVSGVEYWLTGLEPATSPAVEQPATATAT